MAFASIVVNDGTADRTYVPINVRDGSISYRDVTTSTLALPKNCEISHQAGSNTKPDRHLIKFTVTDDNVDGTAVDTATAHIVLTMPRKILTLAQMEALIAQMSDFLTTSDYVTAVLNGSYPA